MRFESAELKKIFQQIHKLNRKNAMLCEKFGGDAKFAKLCKNQQPTGRVSDNLPLYNLLNEAKAKIDARLVNMQDMLSNPGYFRQATGEDVIDVYETNGYKVSPGLVNKLAQNTADEYLNEYGGNKWN